MRLLLVEDDELLGDGIVNGLKQESYIVDWVKDGIMAEAAIFSGGFDCVVLDINLPKRSGLDVLKRVRQKGVEVPVILLTANTAIEDRVNGLDAGADDYLPKPFKLEELTARLRALTRRAAGRSTPMIVHGDIELDPAGHHVTKGGKPVKLSRREFALLERLLSQPGKVVSREQMIEALYGWDDEIDSNALEVHIHNLRKKFGGELITTIRGVGYIIQKPETKS